jgi:hypothetical protein
MIEKFIVLITSMNGDEKAYEYVTTSERAEAIALTFSECSPMASVELMRNRNAEVVSCYVSGVRQ